MRTFLERSIWLPCLMALTRASSRASLMLKMSWSPKWQARRWRSMSSWTRRPSAGSLGMVSSIDTASRLGVIVAEVAGGTGMGLLTVGRVNAAGTAARTKPRAARAEFHASGAGRRPDAQPCSRSASLRRRTSLSSTGWHGCQGAASVRRRPGFAHPEQPLLRPARGGLPRGPGPGRRGPDPSERLQGGLLLLLDVEELVQFRDLEDLVDLGVDVAQD